MSTQFDFSNVADLGKFWDGSKDKKGWGGGNFNAYGAGTAQNQSHNVDLLYQNLLGRNADPAGKKYWAGKLADGSNTYQTVADSIKASQEYQDQQIAINDLGVSDADSLKLLDSAYVSPFNKHSGSAAAGWTPDQRLTPAIASATQSNYADQKYKNVGQVFDHLGGGDGGSMTGTPYDDSALRELIGGLTGQLGDLRSAFDAYKKQSATDMQNMWNNANWGWGQTVGGVRTQNELPGWAPRRGGTSGFFGRGGRAGKGLTTSSLNI